MNKLSIICLDGSGETFKKNNREFIDWVSDNDTVSLLYCTEKDLPGVSACGRFFASLKKTDSKYLLCVDESVVLQSEDVEKLEKELASDVPVITLQMRNSGAKSDYTSIISTKFPFYFGKYVLRRDFIENREIIDDPYFRERLVIEAVGEEFFLSDCSVDCLSDEHLETNLAKYYRAFDKDWYTDEIENFVIPSLKMGMDHNQQAVLLWLIWNKFRSNRDIYNKKVLNAEELKAFNESVDNALRLIDDDVFFEQPTIKKVGSYNCCYLYGRVHDKKPDLKVRTLKDEVDYYYNGVFSASDLMYPRVYAINIVKNSISIDFFIQGDAFGLGADGLVDVYANGVNYPYFYTGITFDTTVFGETIYSKKVFNVEIPLSDDSTTEIHFGLNGPETILAIQFRRTESRLTEKSEYTFCNMEGYLLRYCDKSIIVKKGHSDRKLERAYRRDISNIRPNKKEAAAAFGLMRLYDFGLYKPRKPVWIFSDKLYKGGDNGEYLFRYAYENIDYATSYYIIREDTEDFKRLSKKYGKHILPFNSLRQKLMVLYADIIFATHKGVFRFCGFGKTLQEFFRGELSAKVVCIQHGLTIQDMPENQNRVIDNTVAYFCASPMEIENLSQPIYGYSSDQLHLTGLPRYDGLHSDDQKQILLAPTWRRELVITGNKAGDSKEYNPRFKKSKFYEVYNSLINDETLLQCAEETGYKLAFMLHPTIGVQKDDFKPDRRVEVVNGAEALYEPYLTGSSLMVTDYSGVQFDFAYMKKPVVYYHPEELPPTYENSHFSYEKDGFGPIVSNREELVAALCKYMRSGCQIEPQYENRIEKFFPYTDDKNCERICDVIKELFY